MPRNQQLNLKIYTATLRFVAAYVALGLTVWIYDGSLKIEYQAVTLSHYSVKLQEDTRRLQEVSNARLVETPFRSPQLTLWTLGPDEWLLLASS